jgi:hypothetical protein
MIIAAESYCGPEVRFADTTTDLLEPRFWLMAGACPVTRLIGRYRLSLLSLPPLY